MHSCEKAKGRRSITVESDPNMCAAMMMLGNSFGHDDERQQGCARFVCSLYGNNTKIRTMEAAPHTPSPHGHGWDVIDGHIYIHWMDQQPAPKALLQFISCNCLKGHCVGCRCSCRKNVMSCTDACG